MSCGFDVAKDIPGSQPQSFKAKQSKSAPNAVDLTFPVGAQSNRVRTSTDGGKTFTEVTEFGASKGTLKNLAPGQELAISYMPITKTGPGVWSDSITIIVKKS